MSEAAEHGPGGIYADGPNTDIRDDQLYCEFCDKPCEEGGEAEPFIIGLTGTAAHARCLAEWRDRNPVPEEEPA